MVSYVETGDQIVDEISAYADQEIVLNLNVGVQQLFVYGEEERILFCLSVRERASKLTRHGLQDKWKKGLQQWQMGN